MRFSGIALAQACLANALDTTLSNNFAHQCKLREEEEEQQQQQQRTSRSISLPLSSPSFETPSERRNERTDLASRHYFHLLPLSLSHSQ